MLKKDTDTSLNVVNTTIEELISSGKTIEIIYNYSGLDEPDILEVTIDDMVIENVREVKLIATIHSQSSMSIRTQTSDTSGVVVWKDYLVESPNIYSMVRRIDHDS